MLHRVARLRSDPRRRAGPSITPTVQPSVVPLDRLMALALVGAGLALGLLLGRRWRRGE